MRTLYVSITWLFALVLSSQALAFNPSQGNWAKERLPQLKKALLGTNFEAHSMDTAIVIRVHAKGTFNPDRPEMLLPAALGKISQVARHLAADEEISILVLGMSSEPGLSASAHEVSHARASSLASIFRLNKLTSARMQAFGVGMPPDAKLAAGIVIVPRNDLHHFASHFRERPFLVAQE